MSHLGLVLGARRGLLPFLGLLLGVLMLHPGHGQADGWLERLDAAQAEPPWAVRLRTSLGLLEAGFGGELGVHVRPLDGGDAFGWRDEEFWYLASLVKVPVAVELLARVEAGEVSLDDRLVLRRHDYVDGAGPTNWAPVGTELTLRTLLEAMLIVSDNTASDMLIQLLGLDAVNRRAAALVGPPGGLGPITTLVDVRRHAYAALHPAAFTLSGMDFIALRRHESDAERRAAFARRLGLTPGELQVESLDEAFRRYYATPYNSGRLDAFGELLASLAEGRALGPQGSAELLAVLARTSSGPRRLRAGLGRDIRLAHKTGTQHRRVCDAGIATRGMGDATRRVVIVACVRGELDLARSEQRLAAIGRAIREAGVFDALP
ncbi:serine hydrolase [Halomonas sp. E14]|uniref:serine hydrolase n=1 Tax=Halomonas sp. E14 TaxID=3397245 RepID=UPI00403E96DC